MCKALGLLCWCIVFAIYTLLYISEKGAKWGVLSGEVFALLKSIATRVYKKSIAFGVQ